MVQALVAQDNDDEENPDMVCNIIMISKLVKYFNGYYLLLFFFCVFYFYTMLIVILNFVWKWKGIDPEQLMESKLKCVFENPVIKTMTADTTKSDVTTNNGKNKGVGDSVKSLPKVITLFSLILIILHYVSEWYVYFIRFLEKQKKN